MCILLFISARKIFVYTKFQVSSIAKNISLHYFIKLGCDSLYNTTNQGIDRASLLSGEAHKSWKAGQH